MCLMLVSIEAQKSYEHILQKTLIHVPHEKILTEPSKDNIHNYFIIPNDLGYSRITQNLY